MGPCMCETSFHCTWDSSFCAIYSRKWNFKNYTWKLAKDNYFHSITYLSDNYQKARTFYEVKILLENQVTSPLNSTVYDPILPTSLFSDNFSHTFAYKITTSEKRWIGPKSINMVQLLPVMHTSPKLRYGWLVFTRSLSSYRDPFVSILFSLWEYSAAALGNMLFYLQGMEMGENVKGELDLRGEKYRHNNSVIRFVVGSIMQIWWWTRWFLSNIAFFQIALNNRQNLYRWKNISWRGVLCYWAAILMWFFYYFAKTRFFSHANKHTWKAFEAKGWY